MFIYLENNGLEKIKMYPFITLEVNDARQYFIPQGDQVSK